MRKLSVMATCVGVSESAVSRWRGGGPMTLENVTSVCLALNISADWLVLGRGHMDLHIQQDVAAYQEIAREVSRLTADARDRLRHFLVAVAKTS